MTIPPPELVSAIPYGDETLELLKAGCISEEHFLTVQLWWVKVRGFQKLKEAQKKLKNRKALAKKLQDASNAGRKFMASVARSQDVLSELVNYEYHTANPSRQVLARAGIASPDDKAKTAIEDDLAAVKRLITRLEVQAGHLETWVNEISIEPSAQPYKKLIAALIFDLWEKKIHKPMDFSGTGDLVRFAAAVLDKLGLGEDYRSQWNSLEGQLRRWNENRFDDFARAALRTSTYAVGSTLEMHEAWRKKHSDNR
jgi:hypothetical protein